MTNSDQRSTPARGVQDERIYTHIFVAILEQRLLPGTKLNEIALAEVFGVSRTIVRRALARLAQEGVVEQVPNKGATVASPSPEQAKDILQARKLTEESILKLAIERQDAAAIIELGQLIDAEQAAFERGDRGEGLRLSGEFHLRLAQISGNQTLARFMARLVSKTSLIIATYESPSHQGHCSFDEHRALITAIQNRDTERACELMGHHIDHIQVKLRLNDGPTKSPNLKEIFADQLVNPNGYRSKR